VVAEHPIDRLRERHTPATVAALRDDLGPHPDLFRRRIPKHGITRIAASAARKNGVLGADAGDDQSGFISSSAKESTNSSRASFCSSNGFVKSRGGRTSTTFFEDRVVVARFDDFFGLEAIDSFSLLLKTVLPIRRVPEHGVLGVCGRPDPRPAHAFAETARRDARRPSGSGQSRMLTPPGQTWHASAPERA
jgi:hypothetical protein